MTPIAIIEAVATFLWTMAIVGIAEWMWTVARMDRRQHIPHTAELLGNLVPAMVALVVVVMVGAFVGLPSVVVIIAMLFPAGLAFGVQMSLNDLRGTVWPREIVRLALVLVIAAGVVIYRQAS